MAALMGSDVAKLVLGKKKKTKNCFKISTLANSFSSRSLTHAEYLRSEDQTDAYMTFCKNSPHLKEEYEWIKNGYRSCQLFGVTLVDLLRECCELKECRECLLPTASKTINSILNKIFVFIYSKFIHFNIVTDDTKSSSIALDANQ